MPLVLNDCQFTGPALPEPFVKLELEKILNAQKILPKAKDLRKDWEVYRRYLRRLGDVGADRRVLNHVIEPLRNLLGYTKIEKSEDIETREGSESGGWVMSNSGESVLRCWTVSIDTDLDAPSKRGRAYRFSPQNVALRVLAAKGERAGILTDGEELRFLIADPSRRESYITIDLRRSGWRGSSAVPDSFLLLLALASPAGVKFIPELTDKARLAQTEVTKTLRDQARRAVEDFIQGVLDHPENEAKLASYPIRYPSERLRTGEWKYAQAADAQALANELWREGLILVYRLLFILKLESSPDPARAFSFASNTLWRNTYSPNTALSEWVKLCLHERKDTGNVLENGLRNLFRLFVHGLHVPGMTVSPLGGQLFGEGTTPILDWLQWGEVSVAHLLDHLLWTPEGSRQGRMRVHYGHLDVEDLGRVYEALLEREPGISTEPMCRLRRDKLEVVVPVEQGLPYRSDANAKGKKSKVEWIEEIPKRRFYLRVGLGRKSSGSYYTPDAFVKFLVQETLGPLCNERSPLTDPNPGALLTIKTLDPAMGSGHFLVEACRFLGERLYEACRRCDELALALQAAAEQKKAGKRIEDQKILKELDQKILDLSPAEMRQRAEALYQRVVDLPDPDNELVAYLPSRAVEGGDTGVSVWKARALCRRLVAVHCLYGVDKNPLAVELAKLVLWLESYSEGYPLTFLDHRLICGDSLTGPFFEHLTTYPVSNKKMDGLWNKKLAEQLKHKLENALKEVRNLEASVGKDTADIDLKRVAKERLDRVLSDLKALAAMWSGAVMLGAGYHEETDLVYEEAVQAVANGFDLRQFLRDNPLARELQAAGAEGVAYDFAFPEVFWREGDLKKRAGFDVVLGNPPWDKHMPATKEFFAQYDISILDSNTSSERLRIEERILQSKDVRIAHKIYWKAFEETKALFNRLLPYQNYESEGNKSGAQPDLYRYFCEFTVYLLASRGRLGLVVPSGFHANEGATGVRHLFFSQMTLMSYLCFENTNKLFDIHSSFKFALLVAKRETGSSAFAASFYMHEYDEIFYPANHPRRLLLDKRLISASTGKYLSFIELRDKTGLDIFEKCYKNSTASLQSFLKGYQVVCGEELNKTRQSERFSCASDTRPSLILMEGRNIWQYSDRFDYPTEFVVPIAQCFDRRDILRLSCYYRFGYRLIASSTNERTLIATILPPRNVCTQSISVERKIKAPRWVACILTSLWNTYVFDFIARQKIGAAVNKFILNTQPVPILDGIQLFLVHSAVRLVCNHSGFKSLWHEQMNDEWRESTSKEYEFPILSSVSDRWNLQAAVDAVIAYRFGLEADQYKYVLDSFPHTTAPEAPKLCLSMFDELQKIGLDAFTKKYDPYWDIPLNESLPKPVISLPGITDELAAGEEEEAPDLAEIMGIEPEEETEEEEIERLAAKKRPGPPRQPAKIVEPEWWVEWRRVPAVTYVETHDFGTEYAALRGPSSGLRALSVRVDASGMVLSQESIPDGGSKKTKSRGHCSPELLKKVQSLLESTALWSLDDLQFDRSVKYSPEAFIHEVVVSRGNATRTWKAGAGIWPTGFGVVRQLATLLQEQGQHQAGG